MSVIDQHSLVSFPPLVAGERLDQRTFHDRYEAMPPDAHAELLAGIVYLTPAHRADHAEILSTVGYCVFNYQMAIKELDGAGRVTIKMDDLCEVEPDCGLRVPKELGGRTWVDEDGYVCGVPELLIEIDDHSRDLDLGLRKAEYERLGVLEYLFVGLHPPGFLSFIHREGQFVEQPGDADGIFRSVAFPGLWLDPRALYDDDVETLLVVLHQGLATPEHAAFATRLEKARQGTSGST